MKKKSFFNFALVRIIACLIAALIIYLTTFTYLQESYNSAINGGYDYFADKYNSLMVSYHDGEIGEEFIKIITNFYNSEYIKLAKVNEDGSFATIFETDYDIVPVENNMHYWYYATDDDELLSIGETTSKTKGGEWKIKYIRSKEAKEVAYDPENYYFGETWNQIIDYDLNSTLMGKITDIIGNCNYDYYIVKTCYEDESGLHLGRVDKATNFSMRSSLYKDYTDPDKASLYKDTTMTVEEEIVDQGLTVFMRPVRPDAILDENRSLFYANDLDSLMKNQENAEYFLDTFKSSEYEQTGITAYKSFDDGRIAKGTVSYLKMTDGSQYIVEFVKTTLPFGNFFKPFLIIFAVILFVLAAGIALLISLRPYRQYKKAYEDNIFKNNLIDSLAHNLKTPLQILSGYAENLKDVNSEEDKDRYADSILAATGEMNKDIESILKTTEKSDRKFEKCSVRECIEETASKGSFDVEITGDKVIKMDKEYFKTAIYCLLDNALKYKSKDAKIEVVIDPKNIIIMNRTDLNVYTPGFGIAIAGRILEQHKLMLKTDLKDGLFEAKIGNKV